MRPAFVPGFSTRHGLALAVALATTVACAGTRPLRSDDGTLGNTIDIRGSRPRILRAVLASIPDQTERALVHVRSSAGDWIVMGEQQEGSIYRVILAVEAPKVGKGELLGLGSCTLAGKREHDVIAVVKRGDSKVLTDIVGAWRIDPATRTAIPIGTEGMTCDNEG